MKKFLFPLLLSLLALPTFAQVTTTPAAISNGYEGKIKIVFNPAEGNKGMATATACYAHTGLITINSEGDGDWKYTVCSWRDGSDKTKMTKEGDCWVLEIDNLYSYYACPKTEGIKKIAFVFNDGPGGSKEGKTASGGDIFVSVSGWEEQDTQYADPVQQARPSGVSNGIYYGADGTSVTLCTYAASKTEHAKHVFVVGDFNNWEVNEQYQMKRDGNYFWITLTGLTKGKEYAFQYMVVRADGNKVRISDLYSEKLLHSDDRYEPRQVDPSLMAYPSQGRGYVTVIQPGKPTYPWSDATLHFQRPDKNNLVIYELWLYDYTEQRSLPGLMHRLDYIQNLGVNAIELMPVCEFDGNYNWGYSPNHYFALDKAYGTPEMFKAFIDECHRRGMAVILDMVFNHATGNNPMNKLYPYGSDLVQNPWFNVSAPHGDNVYEDWNHGFEPAHEMFIRALKYWIEEYHVDGYRMDLSHGFCSDKPNTSVENITDYYNKAVKPYGAYFILEHWGNNMGSERPQLVNLGCLCWSNTSNAYCQTAMGWLKEGDSFADANKDGYVSYTCSHDEERPFYKALKYGNGDMKSNESARLSRIAANTILSVLLNGPKMIWQYEEIGYDFSINSSIDHPGGTSSDDRCSKKPRPEPLGYFTDSRRMNQYALIAKACQLRTRLLPAVFEGNPTSVNVSSGVAVRSVQWGSEVYAVANFDIAPQTATLPSGTWYDYLVGGSKAAATYTLQPGDVKVFTGTPVEAPAVPTNYDFTQDLISLTDPAHPSAEVKKLFLNGQLLILSPSGTFDLLGRPLY